MATKSNNDSPSIPSRAVLPMSKTDTISNIHSQWPNSVENFTEDVSNEHFTDLTDFSFLRIQREKESFPLETKLCPGDEVLASPISSENRNIALSVTSQSSIGGRELTSPLPKSQTEERQMDSAIIQQSTPIRDSPRCSVLPSKRDLTDDDDDDVGVLFKRKPADRFVHQDNFMESLPLDPIDDSFSPVNDSKNETEIVSFNPCETFQSSLSLSQQIRFNDKWRKWMQQQQHTSDVFSSLLSETLNDSTSVVYHNLQSANTSTPVSTSSPLYQLDSSVPSSGEYSFPPTSGYPSTSQHESFSPDVPRLLKLTRNWFLDTGFTINNQSVNKTPVEELLKISKTEIISCFKLTNNHLTCERAQRQNVRLAAQLLSHPTSVETPPIEDEMISHP
ncbi:hypothetical protein M8J77_003709 [Diaphorina citri]|nr:hypothetical protein M8J77_003709 [Diaphorina citri]